MHIGFEQHCMFDSLVCLLALLLLGQRDSVMHGKSNERLHAFYGNKML